MVRTLKIDVPSILKIIWSLLCLLFYYLCPICHIYYCVCPSDATTNSRLLSFTFLLVLVVVFRLASIGIAIAIDHLLMDPIISAIFGNTDFYRMRGYYYDGSLGEKAKLID